LHTCGKTGLRMKIRALVLVLCLTAAATGQPPTEDGWVPLFNGKDLSGWKRNGDEKWVVEHGTILCASTANKYGYLTTEKSYRDFTLRLKFKGEAGGNSGVFVHSRIIGIDPEHGPDIEGMQVEVDPNVGKHTGGLYESGGRGWVAMPTPDGEQALHPGNWNDLEVSVRGAHIITHLNGVRIVDYNDPSPKFTDGVIGLQIHTGGGVKMRWKEIYIKEN
jgi:3-keto-disaccharide hydrolase